MASSNRFGVAAAVVWSLASAGLIAAAPNGEDERQAARREGGGQGLVRYLGLTEQQLSQWKELQRQHRDETKPLLEEGRALHERLREALAADPKDPRIVGEATIGLDADRRALQQARQRFERQLSALLDSAQKQEFDSFRASRRTQARQRGPATPEPPGGLGAPPSPAATLERPATQPANLEPAGSPPEP